DLCKAKARHELIEPLDRERNVIQHLPTRPNERLIATTSTPDTLARIPRHAAVREPDAARWLTQRAGRLERGPPGLTVADVARIRRLARCLRSTAVANGWKAHSQRVHVTLR